MNRSRSSFPRSAVRPRSARLAAALIAATLLAVGAAAAPDKPTPIEPPSLPGDCAQKCFEKYANNVERCKSIFCTQILFFTFCDEENLATCIDGADTVFEICIANCQGAQA